MKKFLIAVLITVCVLSVPALAGQQLSGGWEVTEETAITKEAQEVFDKATETLTGADYEAVGLLATQVVAGTNYCFLCRCAAAVPDAVPGYSFVYIYRDLGGNAEILGIKEISFGEGIFDAVEEETELE